MYTREEYRDIKARELESIRAYIETMNRSDDPRIQYRGKRAVTDVRDMLEQSAALYGDHILFKQKEARNEPFVDYTFRQVYEDVNALGTALMHLGLGGCNIGVIGKNCCAWGETYIAVAGGTGIIVPLDKELNAEELEQLTVKGELAAIITVEAKHYKTFRNIKSRGTTGLKYVINADIDCESDEDPEAGLLSYKKLISLGKELIGAGDRSYLDAQIINTDPAVILFTSGTTGVSKGVVLSNRNLVVDVIVAQSLVYVDSDDVFFSVLPMHHTYECTATFLECVYTGSTMAICQGLKHITHDLQEIKPTLLLGVPVIFENFYNKIQRAIKAQGKDKLLNGLLRLNRITRRVGIDITKRATRQITDLFGGRMRTLICGGAAIDGDILDFFVDLGFRAVQGYGLTECSPIIALNPDKMGFIENHSAGYLFPFSECKIDEPNKDGIGEICFRGPTVMIGYYMDEEATADALTEDGWFHTGDLGYMDENSYVFITGRKKNVIITGNGKNVFPEELENYLLRDPYIKECMVWADETNEDPLKRGIYATVRIDEESLEGEYTDEELDALIQRELDRINSKLPLFKRINHLIIRKREFDKTTALKIRRFVEDNKCA